MADVSSVFPEHESLRYKKYYDGWIEHKLPNAKTWNPLWLNLRGNMIFIFDSKNTSNPNSLKGQLYLKYDTKVEIINESKKKRGFRFDLHTSSTSGQWKTNKFKCETVGERDLWAAYILGIGTGQIPENLHLLPGQRRDVLLAIQEVHGIPTGAVPSVPPGHPVNFKTSRNSHGRSSIGSRSDSSGSVSSPPSTIQIPRPSYNTSQSNHELSSGLTPPLQSSNLMSESQHQTLFFFTNPRRNQEIPTWFFANCSRERAEVILTKQSQYGNVLMRESTNFQETRTCVISLRRVMEGGAQINHYEVMREKQGFKVNVDNPHCALACLSDVMDYFVSEAGPTTRPMSRNDFDDTDFDYSNARTDKYNDVPQHGMPQSHVPVLPITSSIQTQMSHIPARRASDSISSKGSVPPHSDLPSLPVHAGNKVRQTVDHISQEMSQNTISSNQRSSTQSDQSDEYVNIGQYRRPFAGVSQVFPTASSQSPAVAQLSPPSAHFSNPKLNRFVHNTDINQSSLDVHVGKPSNQTFNNAQDLHSIPNLRNQYPRKEVSNPDINQSSLDVHVGKPSNQTFNNAQDLQSIPNLRNQYPRKEDPGRGVPGMSTPAYANFLVGSSQNTFQQQTNPEVSSPTRSDWPPHDYNGITDKGHRYLEGPNNITVGMTSPTSQTGDTNFSFQEELASRLHGRRQDIYRSKEQV